MMDSGLPTAEEGDRVVRLYQRLLLLYSAGFRKRYGVGMEQMFVERWNDVRDSEHGPRIFAFVITESIGVFIGAVGQRTASLRIPGFTRVRRTNHRHHNGPTGPVGGFSAIAQDARFALRGITKNPVYSLIAVATLALGIGANTAIFSVVDGVLLKPLPYQNPDRLIQIWETDPQGRGWGFSPPNYQSYASEVSLMSGMVAFGSTSLTLTGADDTERISAMQVSAHFFEFLGVPMEVGRGFLPEEDGFTADDASARVVVIGYRLWRKRFGGAQGVLGQTMTLDGIPHMIVGVAPSDPVIGRGRTDVWIPWRFDERDLTIRGRHWLGVMGRLDRDVRLDAARTELDAIADRLGEAYPESNSGWGTLAIPLQDEVVGDVRTPLWILFGAVVFVMLIACANVANLSLARAEARARELSIRAALGAGFSRLVSLLLVENFMLALLGGVAGVWLAYAGLSVLLGGVGNNLPRSGEVTIDLSVLCFTAMTTIFAGLFVGLTAALQTLRKARRTSLEEEGRQAVSAPGRRTMRSALVISETALSLMLVIGAGLLIKSFWTLTGVDTGFDPRNVLTATVSLPEESYQTDEQRAAFYSELLGALSQQPRVSSVALATGLPIVGGRITTISLPEQPDEPIRPIARRRVTADYFRTMGIPLIEGRSFEDTDVPASPHVVIVNEALAQRLFPNDDVVGKHILWGGPYGPESLEIVGVVGSVKQHGLGEESLPAIYLECSQIYVAESMYLAVKSDGPPLQIVQAVRLALRALDPELPLYRISTMEDVISESVGAERFSTLLLCTFAVVALLLGAIGVYGVTSYTVTQRTKEVGVRMALGAARAKVISLIVRQGMALVTFGILLGTVGAFALSRFMSGMLFQVSATDTATYLSVAALLTVVALVSCYLPAKRAADVDPLEAVRHQ